MNKMLLAASLGMLVFVGGCADKHVTPDTPKMTSTETSSAVPPTAYGAPSSAVGTTPEASPTMPPDMAGGEVAPKAAHPKTHATSATPHKTTVAAANTTTAHGKKYVVKKGDTLSAIAKAHYGKVSAIKKILAANPGLDANKIVVGQKITLP